MDIPMNLDNFKFDKITVTLDNKSTKFIVTTGAIGVGKTTWNVMLADHLRSKGFKVYLSNEIPLMDKEFLELFYSDVSKYSFAFQLNIIHKFNYEMLKLYYKQHSYDYVIFDRTNLDTKVFTSKNISDEKELQILNNIFLNNTFKSDDFDYVFYLKPSKNTMIERQQKRNRSSEKSVPKQYLIDIYDKYETMIREIYPNHIVVNNENDVNYDNIFKQYFDGKQYLYNDMKQFFIMLFLILFIIYFIYL